MKCLKESGEILIKLKKIFDNRYYGIWVMDGSHMGEWDDLCNRNDIRQFEDEEYDWDISGNVFEETVVIPNPFIGWLEMSKETALKILVLGYLPNE